MLTTISQDEIDRRLTQVDLLPKKDESIEEETLETLRGILKSLPELEGEVKGTYFRKNGFSYGSKLDWLTIFYVFNSMHMGSGWTSGICSTIEQAQEVAETLTALSGQKCALFMMEFEARVFEELVKLNAVGDFTEKGAEPKFAFEIVLVS